MLGPALLAGVEEENGLAMQGISTLDFVVFVTITSRAGEGEVHKSGFATF